MSFFPTDKTFLKIGPFSIQWYAVLILSGAYLAYHLSQRNARRSHYPSDILGDYFVYVLWCGIIGARLWYCVFYDFNYYFSNPINILKVYEGGLAIHGGLIAGVLFTLWYCKRKNLSFLKMADMIMPNVLLAQAIGRWGNFVNQEAHGGVVDASYYDGILSFLKERMCIDGVYYEPMFFYESILCILGFCLITFLLKPRQNKRGDLFWAYLMWYGLIRFFIEMKRTDALMIFGLKTAQLTSLAGIAIGVCGYIGLFDRFFPKRKPTILFDFDGTLVDTKRAIRDSYEQVLINNGRQDLYTEEFKNEIIGPSLQHIFKKYFPERNSEELIAEYRKYNDEFLKTEADLMPGGRELLEALKKDGYNVGIVSVRAHRSIKLINEILKIGDLSGDQIGCDEVKKMKPDPEGIITIVNRNNWNRDEVIYVGDSDSDIHAGKNYGAYTVGYFDLPVRRQRLLDAGADAYTGDLTEIIEIVKSYPQQV